MTISIMGLNTKTKKQYIEKNIPLAIFYKTLFTFRDCLNDGFINSGEYNFNFGYWVYRQTSLRIFTIGNIDFEIYIDGKSINARCKTSDCT